MEFLENLQFSHSYWEIILPLALMVADIITGYYNAWKNKEVSSSKMRDGMGKKIAELVYIAVGLIIGLAFNLEPIAYFISVYISYMELVSITENCAKLGVKRPKKLEEKISSKEEE